jgi:hypothetical protein
MAVTEAAMVTVAMTGVDMGTGIGDMIGGGTGAMTGIGIGIGIMTGGTAVLRGTGVAAAAVAAAAEAALREVPPAVLQRDAAGVRPVVLQVTAAGAGAGAGAKNGGGRGAEAAARLPGGIAGVTSVLTAASQGNYCHCP